VNNIFKGPLILAALALTFSACSGASSNDGATGDAVDTDTSSDMTAPTLDFNSVRFKLADAGEVKEFSNRVWRTKDKTLKINADMTGDGRIDRVDIIIDYKTDAETPLLTTPFYYGYTLTWPYEVIDFVKVGDIDKDGDADVLLNDKYLLLNISNRSGRPDLGYGAFISRLAEIGDLVAQSRILEAYFAAFSIGIGTPHSWTASGEGASALYDRDLEIDLNVGNCVTWVEQVLAMINSGGTFNGFYEALHRIRYKDAIMSYETRNHYQSVDWIPNNISAGLIKDLLPELLGAEIPTVQGSVDFAKWYAAKDALEGDFSDLSDAEYAARLEEFRQLGSGKEPVSDQIGYYPIEKMMVRSGENIALDPEFIKRLPDVSIFNVVNKGLSVNDKDGKWMSDLLVSHIGFIVKDPSGKVYVFHSTNKTDAGLGIMAQEDFLSFLIHRYVDNPKTNVVGLHLSEPLIKLPQ
jgi:hypothetical protein